ncbi:MAG: hypothetical protein ACHQHP_03350 [Bacteroidia bacterium]
MKTRIFLIGMLAFASVTLFAQKKEAAPKKQKDKILVSRTYTVDISETGTKKPKHTPDEIVFKSGKLTSKFMTTEQHFPAGEYAIASVDTAEKYVEITFTSESQNQDGETIKWDGTVTDDAIEGKAVVTSKKGKVVAEYAFSGNEKEKKGKKK